MAYSTTDLFSRPDGALGIAPSGFPWVSSDPLPPLAISGGQAVPAGGASPVPSLAYIDAREFGSNGQVEVILAGSKVGVGCAFRVLNGYYWWAVTQRAFPRTFQSGTQTVQVGTETYIIGTTTTPVEYEWRQDYTLHVEGDIYGGHYLTAWSTSSTSAPFFPADLLHSHYYGSDPDLSTSGHGHTKRGSPFTTGATRGGETTTLYGSRPVYEEQPVYTTVTSYSIMVEVAIDGIVTVLFDGPVTAPQDTPVDRFTVTLDGVNITVGVPGNAALFTIADSRLQGETRHGIIYRRHSTTPTGVNAGALARYSYYTQGGLYVPHIMK